MIKIANLNQLKEEIERIDNYCFLFGRDKSPTCQVMQVVLGEVCRKRDYKLFYLDISIKKFYRLVLEYGIEAIPHYVFVNKGDILCEGTGTKSKQSLNKRLNEAEA